MHKKLIASLAIPFIALSCFLIQSEYDYRNGSTWEVKITGIDPRDILKGHYIIYRQLWDFDMDKVLAYAERYKKENVKYRSRKDDCLCLSGNQKNPKVYPVKCDDKNKQCESVLKGNLYSTKNSFDRLRDSGNNYDWSSKEDIRFNAGIEKFFIDESLAKPLEEEFQRKTASVEFRVNLSKKAIIKSLKLDGKDWKEVVTEN